MKTELDSTTLLETLKASPHLLAFFVEDVITLINELPEDFNEAYDKARTDNKAMCLVNGYWERHQHPQAEADPDLTLAEVEAMLAGPTLEQQDELDTADREEPEPENQQEYDADLY